MDNDGASVQSVPVQIRTWKGKVSEGHVQVETWGSQARLRRSLKVLGIFWGLGICSVILPLAHFFLVPFFILSGPVVAWFFWNRTSEITGGQGTCPECEKPFKVARSSNKWPLSDLCTGCQSEVTIEQKIEQKVA